MTLAEFQSLVLQNAKWFQGVCNETISSIAEAERRLGLALPPSLAWLLIKWGYSAACGVDSLDDAVAATIRLRTVLDLPEKYIILNDWQDAGVVCLDAAGGKEGSEYPVYWIGSHNLTRLAAGAELDSDVGTFPDFPSWVKERLEITASESED